MAVHFTPIQTTASKVRFTPLRTGTQTRQDFIPLPEAEQGFLGKAWTEAKRGREQALADLAVYNSLTQSPEDLEGSLRAWKQLRSGTILHPIDSNWLGNLFYANARTAGQMYEATKAGGKGAIVAGGIGAAAGGLVGAVVPTVGEEPVTISSGVAIGLRAGAKLGLASGAALFSYRQGVGNMYATMIDQGVSHNTAKKVSQIAGIPYALLEVAQLKALAPNLKQGIRKILEKKTLSLLTSAAKKYGTTLSEEVLEEIGQEITQIGAEDIANYLDKNNVPVSETYLKDRINRVLEVGKEATKSFALLPIPGTALEAGISSVASSTQAEINAAKERVTDKYNIRPEDVVSPISKIEAGLQESIRTYDRQSKLRKKERALRFGQAKEAMQEFTDEYWKYRAKTHLKGEYAKLGINPLQETVPIENYLALSQELRTTNKISTIDAIKLDDALESLFKEGKIFRPHEIAYARKVWGHTFANILEALAETAKDKTVDWTDYLNVPRALSASLDLSRTGKQNILMIGSPKNWLKAITRDWHLLINDEPTARTIEKDYLIKLDKAGNLLNRSGIRWNEWGPTAGYSRGTERFASKIAGKVPGVARSERAYAMGGNALRAEKLLQIAEQRAGKITTDKEWADIGHVLNIITGEGDAKKFGKLGPILNAVFFAPRLLESRVRAFIDLFNPRLSGVARKILAYHVVSFVGLNTGLLGMMSLVPGVDVETDYRSTDFGKIRYKNMRFDFWGGYLPLARLVLRLASGKAKTQAGRIIDVEARDTIASFLQAKLGPVPSFLLDLYRGQTFYGDYVGTDAESLMKEFYNRMTPFVIQDIVDAIKYQGFVPGLVGGSLAFHGFGVQTYPMNKGTEVMFQKDSLAQQIMGDKWDNLGPEVQQYLRDHFPQIEQTERQAYFDKNSFSFLERMAKQNAKAQEEFYSAMPKDVQNEFDVLMLKPSSISRTISSDWFLNDRLYTQYKTQTMLIYRNVLTKLIRADWWKRVSPDTKIEILEETMSKIKKAIRDRIVVEANISDLQKLKRK